MIVSPAGAADAGADWLRVSSPNFQVYTDFNRDKAEKVLRRLEFMHHAFRQLDLGDADSDHPLNVIYFSNEPDFRQYTSGSANTGSFYTGSGRDYIMLYRHSNDMHVLSHEFGHYLLRNLPDAPDWLEEGFAEFCSTVEVGDSGLEFGKAPPYRLETVRNNRLLSPSQFVRMSAHSYAASDDTTAMFYAQSWALVHMLMLSPEYRSNMPKFLELLQKRQSSDTAFRRAFGRSLETALADLQRYVKSDLSSYMIVGIAPPAPPRLNAQSLPRRDVQRLMDHLGDVASQRAR